MSHVFSYQFDELKLTEDLVLKTMGYTSASAPDMIHEYLDEIFKNGNDLCSLKGGYQILDDVSFEKKDFKLLVNSVNLNIKKVVFQQIKKASQIAVFACTAGDKIFEISRKLMADGDFLKGYVYDLFGSLVVEEAMDKIQESLNSEMIKSGLNISNRYSPGYCGWDVSEQKNLFQLLPENFCGIRLTDTCLMLPIKSVSGIIGIGESIKFNPYTCEICDSSNCLYRNLRQV